MSEDKGKRRARPRRSAFTAHAPPDTSQLAAFEQMVRRAVAEGQHKESPTIEALHEWRKPLLKRLESPEVVDRRMRLHVLPFIGTMTSATLRPVHIEAMLAGLSAKLSPATLNKVRNDGKALIRDAQVNDLWHGPNPFEGVRPRKVPERNYVTLTAEEARVILDIVREDWRALFALAIYLGPRKGEIFALTVDDVDLRKQTISFLRSHGRNTTKTGRVRKDIPIPDELYPYLYDAVTRARTGILFPGADGERMREDTKATRILRAAMVNAGMCESWEYSCRRKGCGFKEVRKNPVDAHCPLCDMRLWVSGRPRPMRFYDLRHTSATLHQDAGCSQWVIERVLGHAHKTTTGKTYTHLNDSSIRAELNKMSLQKRHDKTKERRTGLEPATPSLGSSRSGVGRPSPRKTGTGPGLRAQSDLMTVAELAPFLGLSISTVYEHVQLGYIPHIKLGSLIRFSRSAIEEWLKKGGNRK